MKPSPADTLNSDIADMLALEEQIDKTIVGQLIDLDDEEPEFCAALEQAHDVIATHITHLGLVADARGMNGGTRGDRAREERGEQSGRIGFGRR